MKLVIFDLDDTLYDRWGQLDESYSNLPNIKLFPDTLTVLKAPGFRKVLVSFGDQAIQQQKIDILGIREYFDDIIICTTKEQKKVFFVKLAGKYNVDKSDVIIMGDRIDSELRYGKESGFVAVRLIWGKYKDLKPKDEFEVPDYTISKLSDLLDIVGGEK
jgi:FMN phosphatase YigB (HAD superfamily)